MMKYQTLKTCAVRSAGGTGLGLISPANLPIPLKPKTGHFLKPWQRKGCKKT
ncbi:hypothetical protein IQ267_03165 [filamentous cyanobacterium LEGE 07170]|nr:hypothetical protein [filamentous cyanobacterium LEGE 07170]